MGNKHQFLLPLNHAEPKMFNYLILKPDLNIGVNENLKNACIISIHQHKRPFGASGLDSPNNTQCYLYSAVNR